MATTLVDSDDGELASASAVLRVRGTNAEDDQPALAEPPIVTAVLRRGAARPSGRARDPAGFEPADTVPARVQWVIGHCR